MKRIVKYFIAFAAIISFTCSSCETDNIGESITGSWRCREESGNMNYKQFSVNIDYASDIDTTLFIIYNFHNQGFEVETYARLRDTVLTLLQTNTMSNVAGTGYVSKDFRSINWEYSVDNEYVSAYFFRK